MKTGRPGMAGRVIKVSMGQETEFAGRCCRRKEVLHPPSDTPARHKCIQDQT
jgi:hypothetical protein